MKTIRRAVLVVGVAAALGAHAQDLNIGQGYSNMASGLMQTSMLNMAIRNAGEPHGAAAKASVRTDALTYTESPAVTARVRKNFVAFLRGQGLNEGATSMEAYLAKADFRKDWAASAAPDGLKRGNALDALTEYWVTNWAIANGKTSTTPAQARGLKAQMAPLMAGNPTFRKLGNAGRQELAEVWMINTIAQGGGYMAAVRQGDKAMIQKASDAAVTRFKNETKIDLRAVKLTDRGFVR